jgi:hypothetical protein
MCRTHKSKLPDTPLITFARAMGAPFDRRPEWLIDKIAIESALATDVKGIDKPEHLFRSISERAAIRRSKSYRRKHAKVSCAMVAYRAAGADVWELRKLTTEDKTDEGVVLRFRPQIVAVEPLLQNDVVCHGAFCAIDLVFTEWAENYIRPRYDGPGELSFDEGSSFLDVTEIAIYGPAGKINWQAAGEALGAIFDKKFDAAAAALIKKVRRMHQLARR